MLGKSKKKTVPSYLPEPSRSTKIIDPKEYEEQERNPLSKMLHGLGGITGRRAKDIGYYLTSPYRYFHRGKNR